MVGMHFPSLFLTLFVVLSSATVSSSPLSEVCGNLDDAYITKEMCTSFFSADPDADKAPNIRSLEIIAANITLRKAVEILILVKEAENNATDAAIKRHAETAVLLFSHAVASLELVKHYIAAGNMGAAETAAKSGEVDVSSLGHLGLVRLEMPYAVSALIVDVIIRKYP